MQRAARLAIAAVLALVVAPQGASADGLTVDLTPMAGTAVNQGDTFLFRAVVRNGGAEAVDDAVSFELAADGRRTVPFMRKLIVVPGNSSLTIDGAVVPTQWFDGRGPVTLTARRAGALVGQPLQIRLRKARVAVPRFADVTAKAGLMTYVPPTGCVGFTAGAAWLDVDHDGRLDLFLARLGSPPALFMGRPGGTFADESLARGVPADLGAVVGASAADYDNDGWTDLYVVVNGQGRLLRNDEGRLRDVTAPAGIIGDGPGTSASWGDYDDDGLVDLYVTQHVRCNYGRPGTGFTYHPDQLWHNEGNGTFTDRTALLGANATLGAGYQTAWFDYDRDGRPDLYLGNDYLGPKPDRNHLWHNEGPDGAGGWRFTDVSVASRTSLVMNTMGIGIGDYDRDGRMDLALSNWSSTRLLHNLGNGTFAEVGKAAGVARPFQQASRRSITWGIDFADLNLDGWEDLYVAAGFLTGFYGSDDTPQANGVFVNARHGRFLDLSALSGADDRGQSRGAALADYDRDGRIDVLLVDVAGAPHLFRNVTPRGGRHWLEVRTVGTASNRGGCGARLKLTSASGRQTREVICGSTSISSSRDATVHFGLGRERTARRLTIIWPSGRTQTLDRIAGDRSIVVTEPAAGA